MTIPSIWCLLHLSHTSFFNHLYSFLEASSAEIKASYLTSSSPKPIMLPVLLLALLGSQSVLATQIAGLASRGDISADQCCPCPSPGTSDDGTTITVTESALPVETIYVNPHDGTPQKPETVVEKHTVTKTAQASTIYVTHGNVYEPTTVTVEDPNETPELSPGTVIISIEEPLTPTKDVEDPVTLSDEPLHGSTVTITQGVPSETPEYPQVVTIIVHPSDSPESTTPSGAHELVVTKTIADGTDEDHEPQTIIISQEPVIQTVTISNGDVSTQSMSHADPVTITVAPDAETSLATQSADQYSTLTRTVTTGGNGGDGGSGDVDVDIDIDIDIDVEIIIINLETGEQTCMNKDTGKPCDGTSGSSYITIDSPCPSPKTSFATVYNTVIVTGTGASTGLGYANSTMAVGAAQPSGTLAIRKPRGPLARLW